MIKVQNGVATREAPPSWMPKNTELLRDTSWVTDPTDAVRLGGAVWCPEEDRTPELQEGQTYDGAETLTVGDGVVYVERGIRHLTPEELRANMPQSCTPAQGLVALFAVKNITEDQLLQAIEQIPDAVTRYTVKIGFQRAITWERQSQSMQVMAQLLSLTEEDLDALFEFAVTVTV